MDIRKIDFGRDIAELDGALSDYFLTTSAYEDVISGRKSLLIGRKGSGKTAIMKYCVDNEKRATQCIYKIEATHATYSKISEKLLSVASSIQHLDSSFKLAWLLTTLVRLIDRFLEENLFAVTHDEKVLYEFATEKLGYDRNDSISAIAGYVFDWYRNLRKVDKLERDIPKPAIKEIDAFHFDEVKLLKMIGHAANRLNQRGQSVYIFYDKLDERWDSSDLHIAFLQGLFLALKDIKTLGYRIYPVALLRDDIFRSVTRNFQHIDHYRMEIANVRWDETSLIELIGLRIRNSLKNAGERSLAESNKDLWALAFPQEFPDRMHTHPSYTYLIERTLFRPRDIIFLCSLIGDYARELRKENLTSEEVKICEKNYSQQKRYDVSAEFSHQYLGLDLLMEKFWKRTNGYNREELDYAIAQIQDELAPPNQFKSMDVRDVLKVLYEVGFLCYTTKGGILRGTRIIHSGITPNPDEFFQQARVYISPIFRKGLDLKDH